MSESRHPQLGDMIVQRCQRAPCHPSGCVHIGIVHGFEKGTWSDRNENAFIAWSTDPPPRYADEYGIATVNIHNLRNEYDVIRKGVSIK